jgi:hypothetical protein
VHHDAQDQTYHRHFAAKVMEAEKEGSKMQVKISAKSVDLNEVKASLEKTIGSTEEIEFQVHQPDDRAIETAVLVALIGAGGTVLGALISGIMQLAREKASAKIIVQTEKGRIEAPVILPKEQFERLIDRVNLLKADKVNIHLE